MVKEKSMFKDETTSEIIGFLNSIISSGKADDFQNLYQEALHELKQRCPMLGTLYTYYNEFK